MARQLCASALFRLLVQPIRFDPPSYGGEERTPARGPRVGMVTTSCGPQTEGSGTSPGGVDSTRKLRPTLTCAGSTIGKGTMKLSPRPGHAERPASRPNPMEATICEGRPQSQACEGRPQSGGRPTHGHSSGFNQKAQASAVATLMPARKGPATHSSWGYSVVQPDGKGSFSSEGHRWDKGKGGKGGACLSYPLPTPLLRRQQTPNRPLQRLPQRMTVDRPLQRLPQRMTVGQASRIGCQGSGE